MADRELEYWDVDGNAFLKIVRSWPKKVRAAIGADIRRVQRGMEPKNSRLLKGMPVQAAEIKHNDGGRVVYSVAFAAISGKVFIADAFMKDSAHRSEMRPSVQKRIQGRLKDYQQRYSRSSTGRLN